jgi:hypothetical protein
MDMQQQEKINQLVELETKRIRRKRPELLSLNLVYKEQNGGAFFSKLNARVKGRSIVLKEEARCLETGIRTVFGNLCSVLSKNKVRRLNRVSGQVRSSL